LPASNCDKLLALLMDCQAGRSGSEDDKLAFLSRPTSFRASITASSTRLGAPTHNIELAD